MQNNFENCVRPIPQNPIQVLVLDLVCLRVLRRATRSFSLQAVLLFSTETTTLSVERIMILERLLHRMTSCRSAAARRRVVCPNRD